MNKVRNERANFPFSNWDLIKSPAADQIVPYDKLPTQFNAQNLSKLAVLKVNGGLGTSMGELPLGHYDVPLIAMIVRYDRSQIRSRSQG